MRALFTIGYQGSQLDGFLNTLKSKQIELLLDVRELPLSRKKGFSKTALKQALAEQGIAYNHLRALGDPKPGRDAVRRGDRATFEAIYYSHLQSEPAQAALRQAIDLSQRQRCCLLCFEHEAQGCHRKIVVDAMAEAVDFQIEHLEIP